MLRRVSFFIFFKKSKGEKMKKSKKSKKFTAKKRLPNGKILLASSITKELVEERINGQYKFVTQNRYYK